MNRESFAKRLAEALAHAKMTQSELAERSNTSKSAISSYLSGVYEAKQNRVDLFARILNVDPAWLMGYNTPMQRPAGSLPSDPDPLPPNVFRPKLKKVPLLGTTAAGEPILSEEHFEGYVDAYDIDDADFCLHVQGDSMTGIGINDGDIVFFKSQKEVENGQVAVVRIDGEAVTLKRFYRQGDSIILQSENPSMMPMIFHAGNCTDFQILGLAIIKQGKIQ
ncbi:MAG: helix-turn-helix domain-containing protein [Veillonellaceae bacterium]|nr:helix-turn-helix domain-containing protein [Veillonellaceae bacterium]